MKVSLSDSATEFVTEDNHYHSVVGFYTHKADDHFMVTMFRRNDNHYQDVALWELYYDGWHYRGSLFETKELTLLDVLARALKDNEVMP